MEPSQDFVDNHAIVFQRQAEIEVEDETLSVEISLSEGGQLNLETSRPGLDTEGLETGIYPEVTGTTEQGEQVIITDLFCFADELLSLNPSVIEICSSGDRVVEGEEITLTADILGFQYKGTPRFSDPDDHVNLIERTDWRAGSGNAADWNISVRPLPDYTTRVNSIQNYQNLVRTVQFEVSISGLYGGLDRIGTVSEGLLNEVTWLSSYVQGTLPSHSKLEIREDKSNQPDYVRIRSLHGNVGGCCKSGNFLLMVGQELPLFLDRAYEKFREQQESLELRKVLGFYVDSLDPNRPVDVKLANLCIATEMLADRYLEEDPGPTADMISGLVNGVGVKYQDLIPENGSLKTQYGDDIYGRDDITPEYFWCPARNHVIHGGSSVTTSEISRDYNALLRLLQRLLREMLLEDETGSLRGMTDLEPNEFVSR